MKFKSLILAFLMIVSSSASATVTTSAVAGAVARANAHAHQRERERTNNAIRSVNNALKNGNRVLVQCKPKYVGGFFENSRVNRELTIEACEDEKKKFERLNGVEYKFGKAVSYDRYNSSFYFELIEVEER